MNSLWDIRIFLDLVPKESPCIWRSLLFRLKTTCFSPVIFSLNKRLLQILQLCFDLPYLLSHCTLNTTGMSQLKLDFMVRYYFPFWLAIPMLLKDKYNIGIQCQWQHDCKAWERNRACPLLMCFPITWLARLRKATQNHYHGIQSIDSDSCKRLSEGNRTAKHCTQTFSPVLCCSHGMCRSYMFGG
jgi:hypothetical protein